MCITFSYDKMAQSPFLEASIKEKVAGKLGFFNVIPRQMHFHCTAEHKRVSLVCTMVGQSGHVFEFTCEADTMYDAVDMAAHRFLRQLMAHHIQGA